MRPVQLIFLSEGNETWRTFPVAGAPARSPRCILVVPGAYVLAREIEAAGSTPAQSRAAALAALAPDLAAPVDQLVCGVGAAGAGQHIALIAARNQIDGWLNSARERGLTPDAVLPDYMMLPVPELGQVQVATSGEDVIVRLGHAGFACQHDLADQLIGARTRVAANLEQAAIEAVRRGAIASAPSLLAGLTRTSRNVPTRSMLWPVAAAAAALVIATVAPWVSASRINGATAELREAGDAAARAALPNARRIVDAKAQLREAAMPRERTGQALTYATGVLEGLSRTSGVQLSRLEFGADGVMHASLTAADLSQLQPLRDHIALLGLRSAETPGQSSPNSLSVDFTVTGAP